MLPWWVTLILAFVGIFIFNNFYEFIVSFVIMYSIYMIPGVKITPFWFSLIISTLYLGIQGIRHYIILYKQ